MDFYPLSLVFVGVILAPNLLGMFFPPVNIPKGSNSKAIWWFVIILLEWVGRMGTLILPAFYELKIDGAGKGLVLLCMLGCVVIYYMGWYRYLMQGREFALLFKPMGVILVPMAVFPVLYFLLLGVVLNSWVIVLVTIIFGIGHILESLRNYHTCQVR